MSENIYYPLFLWAVFFSFNPNHEGNNKPSIFKNTVFGVILGFMLLTRYTALVQVPAFLFIWWITQPKFPQFEFINKY